MKRNVGKKRLAFILVAVCLVGVIGIGISYSYYLANISTSNEENKNSNITTTTITNVVMDMQGKVSSNGAYPGHKMVKEVVVRGIGESNSLPANASIKITPDLGDFSSDVTWKLYKSDTPITCTSKVKEGIQYYDEATCDIPKSASLLLEGGAESDFLNITVNPLSETKYYLVVEYANNGDQSSQMGKSFSITIELGSKGTKPVPIVNKITELAQSDTVNLASDDPGKNVRYIGANPSNYVYFNCSDYNNPTTDTCELWRIIGVFNNVTKGNGTKENLVKIIRADSLDKYYWDNKGKGVGTSIGDGDFGFSDYGSNDWSDSQLMMMLNPTNYLKSGYTNSSDIISLGSQQLYSKMGSYYNGTMGCKPAEVASGASFSCTVVDFTSTGLKNDITRNAIEEVVWNLGGISNTWSSDDVQLVSHWYGYERGTTVYTGRPTIWTGKIGLMYPSDFIYATSGGTAKDRATCLAKELHDGGSSDFSDCTENDYLLYKPGYGQWTLTTSSTRADGVYIVDSGGNVSQTSAYDTIAVRPALFLKSNILVDKGTGAKSDPYTLKMQ